MDDVVTSAARRAAYSAYGWWDAATLAGQVAGHAAAQPTAPAVVAGGRRHTYGELAADAAGLAAWLADRGIGGGDVVSVQLPNTYDAVVTAVAVQSLGAVINPLLPNYRAKELSHVFTAARPAAIFTPAEYRGFDHRALVASVASTTGVRPLHVASAPSGSSGEQLRVDAPASAVSELIFTSGTEASPKAVMHTEQTTNFSVRVAYDDLGMGPDDVVWMPSPVGHSTGFNYGLRFALYHGLPLVLQDRWDAVEAIGLIESERCSYTLAATTFLQDLVEEAARRRVTLPSLRCFGCGGAPVPPEVVQAALDRGITVLRLYGSTEVLVATWNRPATPLHQRLHTDGTAMSHVDVELRGEEIFVRGPNTCVGFFDDPLRTASTFDSDGWVRSGDLAACDGLGHLTIVGRKKEIIIRGGINIAPREIEELLLTFPEVLRAAVIGIPDRRLGERSCACVVLRTGAALSLDETVARLKALGLATFKLPERLEILDALPTTASGKIQKHELVRALS